jgi:hypothetical protein
VAIEIGQRRDGACVRMADGPDRHERLDGVGARGDDGAEAQADASDPDHDEAPADLGAQLARGEGVRLREHGVEREPLERAHLHPFGRIGLAERGERPSRASERGDVLGPVRGAREIDEQRSERRLDRPDVVAGSGGEAGVDPPLRELARGDERVGDRAGSRVVRSEIVRERGERRTRRDPPHALAVHDHATPLETPASDARHAWAPCAPRKATLRASALAGRSARRPIGFESSLCVKSH